MSNEKNITPNDVKFSDGKAIIKDRELSNALLHHPDKAVDSLSKKLGKLTLDQIEFDDEGRIVLNNPEVAANVQKMMDDAKKNNAASFNMVCCSDFVCCNALC